MLVRKGSLGWTTKKVVDFIATNPGCTGRTVQTHMGRSFKSIQVTQILSNARKRELIENRGGHGLAARWYIKES